MPLKVIIDDILRQNADAIVITTKPRPYSIVTGTGSIVFEAAGYDKMLDARASFEKIKPGEIVVTPGFDLNVRHVIHICELFPYNGNAAEYQAAIREGVLRALQWAEQNELKSIAFSVIGERDLSEETISDTIRTYFKTENSLMDVCFVIPPPDEEPVNYGRREGDRPAVSTPAPENYDDDYAKYSARFEEQFKKADIPRKAFRREYIDRRLYGLNNISAAARTIGCNRTTLHRIINGGIAKPDKSTVLALAIILELSDEERYNFIKCFEYRYPIDTRDRLIESLMRSGIRDFESINERICKQNPEKALKKKAPRPKNTKEK